MKKGRPLREKKTTRKVEVVSLQIIIKLMVNFKSAILIDCLEKLNSDVSKR